MKKLLLLALLALAGTCFAKDVYVRPTVVSGDTIRARGKTYRLWGISAPKGGWNTVAMAALSQMTKGLEFKLLVNKNYPGVAKFGVFDRDGGKQINPALKLLKMGLATFRPGDRPADDKNAAIYREAEAAAKKAKIGIWSE